MGPIMWLVLAIGDDAFAVRAPEPLVVRVGEPAVVRWVTEGVDAAPRPAEFPSIDGLTVVPLPSRTERIQTIEAGVVGARSRTSWPFAVTATVPGRFRIESPAVIDAPSASGAVDLVVVEDPSGPAGPDVAFCEVEVDRDDVTLHEPFTVTVRFGFDERFLAESLLPLFGRRLDVPVQVVVPWTDGLPGGELGAWEPSITGNGGATFALGESEATARRVETSGPAGRRFVGFEVSRRVLPTSSGELTIGSATLRYAYATRFSDGLFERVPEDRHEAYAIGAARTVRIRPLPDDGRPAAFAGAVGRFTLEAVASADQVAVGESVRVTITLAGDGASEVGAPPTYALGDGFHVRGRQEERTGGARVTTIDATPIRADVTALGPFSVAIFDPSSGAFRTLRTAPLPLRVTGERGAASVSAPSLEPADPLDAGLRVTPGVNDLFDVRPLSRRSGDTSASEPSSPIGAAGPWFGATLLAALGGLLLSRLARERALRRLDPAGVRARRAARAFRRRVRGGDEGTAAFEEYLAARLGVDLPAVVDPMLAARLVAAGVSTDEAAETARTLESTRASRFGGPPGPGSKEEWKNRVDRLERAFTAAGERR